MVSKSKRKQHVIAAKTTGIAEKNILNQDNGIMNIHANARYYGNGDKEDKIPHIKFEDKIIYILGYDNRDKWEMVLGSQFGCVYIDEINTANIDFVREVSTRNEYMLATLNPDDPALPVYKEFINRSRPYKKYAGDVPAEIAAELNERAVPNWRYWFFTFRDNLSLTEADIKKKIAAAPPGTKLYKNKILGLRGRATGLVFPNFDRSKHVVSKEWLKEKLESGEIVFKKFTSGLDTAYSQKSPDTIAAIFQGITECGKLIVLDEMVLANQNRQVPLAPSDVVPKYIEFLDRNGQEWGIVRDVFIDSADQATKTELMKYKRTHGCLYNFFDSYKKVKIIDRINLMLGWFQKDQYLVLDHCSEHIRELEIYSWQEEKDIPEDANDHTINGSQYGWIPYREIIGTGE
jgi:PBSX family phage terminase large subunit